MAPSLADAFENYKVSDFDDSDIREFCKKWYTLIGHYNKKNEAEEVGNQILLKSEIKQLAKNPLLLTTMLIVKMRIGRIPAKRSVLYREFIKLLLESWNYEAYEQLDLDETTCQLAYIAYYMQVKNMQQINLSELKKVLKQARKDLSAELSPSSIKDPISVFITNVESRSSIIQKVGENDGEDLYEFQHLTFQEYLCAVAIVEGYYPEEEQKGTEDILEDVCMNSDWEEVVLLSASLMKRDVKKLVEYLISEYKESTVFTYNKRNKKISELLLKIVLDEGTMKPELRSRIYNLIWNRENVLDSLRFLGEIKKTPYVDELYEELSKSIQTESFVYDLPAIRVLNKLENNDNSDNQRFGDTIKKAMVKFSSDYVIDVQKCIMLITDIFEKNEGLFEEKGFFKVVKVLMIILKNDKTFDTDQITKIANGYTSFLNKCLDNIHNRFDEIGYWSLLLFINLAYRFGDISMLVEDFQVENKELLKILYPEFICDPNIISLIIKYDRMFDDRVSMIRPCFLWKNHGYDQSVMRKTLKSLSREDKEYLIKMHNQCYGQYKTAYGELASLL